MSPNHPAISDSELAILKVLWDRGAATVRELLDHLQRDGYSWAYTTVQTLLHRLCTKDYVVCDKDSRAHVFRAALSRDALLAQELDELADRVCDGAATPLVLNLVKAGRFSEEDIKRFRRLLDQLTHDSSHGTARKSREE